MPVATSTESTAPTSLLFSRVARLASSLLKPKEDVLPTPDDMDVLFFSAQICASARAFETSLPPERRLFTDPYAEALAGPEAMERMRARLQKLQRQHPTPGRPRIAVRTRYFDDFANSALHRFAPSIAQLVSLAAGLDTRAYRLDELSKAVSVFEVDCAEVLMRKKRILEQLEPRPVVLAGSRTPVVADLSKAGWQPRLELAGFDHNIKTVWLLEGILYYLEEERVSQLLREICRMSALGSCLCFSAITSLKGTTTSRISGRPKFMSAMPDPQAVLEEAGWEVDSIDQVGGPNANYGRWEVVEPIGPDDWKKERVTVYVSGTKRR